MNSRTTHLLVLGGGTAGFLTALTLRRRMPDAEITVLQSSKLGVIGVGEGSLRQLPGFLHRTLGIDPAAFFEAVRPTWKLGIRFVWGGRDHFDYTFSPQLDVTHPHPDLTHPMGWYCQREMRNHCVASVLMDNDLVYRTDASGEPIIEGDFGYHLENHRLAAFLEHTALARNIRLIDDTVLDVDVDETGVTALRLESGATASADLYVDCSGFASLLIGKHLFEDFVSYRDSLFCDRAVIGGWERTSEPVHPYTTSETMNCGWCWQIEHEDRINRGYVYSSDFISDEDAEKEFRAKNPKLTDTRIVHFRSGRFRNAWVRNVVAIGNSAGFVEPLEATAIAAICSIAHALAETVGECGTQASDAVRAQFNQYNARSWDSIRDFLAVHYKFNSRLDNEFWRACRNDVALHGAERIVDFYRANGPSSLWRLTLEDPICRFKLDGYFTMLVGQQVAHDRVDEVSDTEWAAWQKLQAATTQFAGRGIGVVPLLERVRRPDWQWRPEHFGTGN